MPLNKATFLGLCLILLVALPGNADPGGDIPVALIIHGGAGNIRPEGMTAERQQEYRDALAASLRTGHAVLARGGSALDAVEAAIRVMEDSPLFNAARGAKFTNSGHNELDASIMDGRDRNAGAVAAVRYVKNPITLARLVMENSHHVMLIGEGAAEFGRQQGVEFEDSAYFWTERRWLQYEKAKEKDAYVPTGQIDLDNTEDRTFGTVGAVARDARGDIAAATSTGGTTNKLFGRVGDSPIIGAGTWADNRTCGVSCTGTGEYFIRGVIAYRVSVLMEQGLSLDAAARRVIHEEVIELGGPETGGLIALDHDGNITMEFNTTGMYRGFIRSDGKPYTFLFGDDSEQ